jgi:muramoyltetrapeptide carboxypeptidase
MIIPEKLKIGNKIGIVSTARKITLEELSPAIKLLENWGFEVVFGANLFKENNQFSGTVEQRTADLQSMIDNDAIKAVLCARGGYGTVQIIDNINFSSLKKDPKWIIGYSDVTVLHAHLNNLGIASLHATMPINFANNSNESLQSLNNSLLGKSNRIECMGHALNLLGEAEAEIVGGNLSILYSLSASISDIDTERKILFIEDLDEYLYHIDRMMMNLNRNGKLAKLKALIVGGMKDMNDNEIPFGKSVEEIILEHTKKYDYPICFGFPAGHINDNRCIKLGVKSVLKITKNGVSLFQE